MWKQRTDKSGERILSVNPLRPQPELLTQAADLIHRGGVIAFPTETFYGLGADALNRQAIKRIYTIKGRDRTKPILILVEARATINQFVKPFPSRVERLMEAFWPGPLTILFQASDRIPIELTAGSGKIGIRVPSHPVAMALLKICQRPLTGTSANRAGRPSPRAAEEVINRLGQELDLVLDGGPTPGEKPSTILDCTVSPFQVVREGILSRETLKPWLER